MKEWKKWIIIICVFIGALLIPFSNERVINAIMESFHMLQEYARDHVLLCLVPAFFIAGAIGVFVSQSSVMKYFGAKANKILSYSVASVSGSILSVCSCTVLPIFAGIYQRGAGLGPAIAFLYSGPAINALAIILTARVLGLKLGLARAFGAVVFSIIIGLIMHFIFLKEERAKILDKDITLPAEEKVRPLWKTSIYFFVMIAILIFLNWAKDGGGNMFLWDVIYQYKFFIAAVFGIILLLMIIFWFKKAELKNWIISTKDFALQIAPLLFGGVMVAGFLLGRPNHTGIIPEKYVVMFVGGNSFFSNFFASISGALMYFATLTEVPIIQGLIGKGMGGGPALALLLAGPALSLPNMLVIRSVIGIKKTLIYVLLVVILSTFAGWGYGFIFNE